MGLNLFQRVARDKHDSMGKDEGHWSTITTIPKFSYSALQQYSFSSFFSVLTPHGLCILNCSHLCPYMTPLFARITFAFLIHFVPTCLYLSVEELSVQVSTVLSPTPKLTPLLRVGLTRWSATEITDPQSRKIGCMHSVIFLFSYTPTLTQGRFTWCFWCPCYKNTRQNCHILPPRFTIGWWNWGFDPILASCVYSQSDGEGLMATFLQTSSTPIPVEHPKAYVLGMLQWECNQTHPSPPGKASAPCRIHSQGRLTTSTQQLICHHLLCPRHCAKHWSSSNK